MPTPTVDWHTLLGLASRASIEDDLVVELAAYALQAAGADSCDIFMRSGESLVLKASTRAPEFVNRIRLGKRKGLCGQCLVDQKPVFLATKISAHPDYARYPGIDDPEWEGGAVLPITDGDARVGVLMLRRMSVWKATASERAHLVDLAKAYGAVLNSFDKIYASGSNASRLGALSDVSRTIAASPYMEEILQLLVNLTAQRFNYIVCTVRLLDVQHNELVLRATQAPAKAYAKKRALKLGESIAGRAIAANKPIIVRDVQEEADYVGHDLAVEQGMRSMICVPLTIQDRVLGVLSCYTSEVHEFEEDEVRALETLAKQAAVSIEHAKLQVRSTLMQEMHHRVKNNLQQVASLLRLQLRHGNYKSLEEAINDSLSRILAISSVHDLLSREDLDHVGIRAIAEMLVLHQKNSLILPDRHIGFVIRGGDARGNDVRLNMAQATQVALLLNELIQNAVEHGFETTRDGEIHVTIERDDAEVSLWVSNSGDPLPEDFDASTSSSLGLQIVQNLARALGGKFKISNILGWAVAEVKFPPSSME